jgi:hypothetical protein
MSSYNKKTEHNNLICEAAGCFTRATVEIEVRVGPKDTIQLNLCEKCVSEFQDGNNEVSSAYSTEYSTQQLKESSKI